MRGVVNKRYEAILRVRLRGPSDNVLEVDAVIDTSYISYLTSPFDLIQQLQLKIESKGYALLADGSPLVFETYTGEIEWQGQWQPVLISTVGDETLLGMGLLAGHKLAVDVIPGGLVEIASLGL